MNIVLEPDRTKLAPHHGENLWFCEYCRSLMFFQHKDLWDYSKGGFLRLRKKYDTCHCREYKINALKPQPKIEWEATKKEVIYFPNSSSTVSKIHTTYAIRVIPTH